eukprot:jgi/Hompol1/4176/HPOL_006967-RA
MDRILFKPWSQLKPRTKWQIILAAVLSAIFAVAVPLLAIQNDTIGSRKVSPDFAAHSYPESLDPT